MQHKNLLDLPEDVLKNLFTLFSPIDSLSASLACKRLQAMFRKNIEMQEAIKKNKIKERLSQLNTCIDNEVVVITLDGNKKIKINETTQELPISKTVIKITDILYVDSDRVIFRANTSKGIEYCTADTASLELLMSTAEKSHTNTNKRMSLSTIYSTVIEEAELPEIISLCRKNSLFKVLYTQACKTLNEFFSRIEDFPRLTLYQKQNALRISKIEFSLQDVVPPLEYCSFILERLKQRGVIDYEFGKLQTTHYYKPQFGEPFYLTKNLKITIKNFNLISKACAELQPLADFINDFMRTNNHEGTNHCSTEEAEKKISELNKNGEIPFVYRYDEKSKDWVLTYLHQGEIHHKKIVNKVLACEILATLFENHQLTLQPMQVVRRSRF